MTAKIDKLRTKALDRVNYLLTDHAAVKLPRMRRQLEEAVLIMHTDFTATSNETIIINNEPVTIDAISVKDIPTETLLEILHYILTYFGVPETIRK